MRKQLLLPVPGVATLEALWVRFPERCRSEVLVLYAQLIARAVKTSAPPEKKEPAHDSRAR